MPNKLPIAITAAEAAPRAKPTRYPAPFAPLMNGRTKRTLGDLFGLGNFGVNLTELAPGALSSLRHAHAKQDEFVYIVSGTPTLVTDEGETALSAGMCAGFKAGNGNAHHLVNRSATSAVYLEIGDRTAGDSVIYPDDDVKAELDAGGKWQYSRKDGTPF